MTTYKLYGHINFLETKSGFVMPVFKDENYFYSQVEDDGEVIEFIKLPDEYQTNIKSADLLPTNSKPGDPCIYGFYHHDEVYFGTPNVLAPIFHNIRPDDKLISAFAHRYDLTLPGSEEVTISPSRPFQKNKVEHSIGEPTHRKPAVLAVLKTVHDNRKAFYRILKQRAIFQSGEISSFISENMRLSQKCSQQLQFFILGMTKIKRGERKRNPSRARSVSVFKSAHISANSSVLIKKWISDEIEAQAHYREALNPNNHFSVEITSSLRKHYSALSRSYEKLKTLVYGYSDVEI